MVYVVEVCGVLVLYVGIQVVQCVVGDLQSFFFGFEGGYCYYWFEDFFLEDVYVVVVFEYGGFYVVIIGQVVIQGVLFVIDQYFGFFLFVDVDVGEDFVQLFGGGLCVDYGVWVQWIILFDCGYVFEYLFYEMFVDGFLYQCM